MTNEKELVTQDELITIIEDFISTTEGLQFKRQTEHLSIYQKTDSREMVIKRSDLSDVLTRKDADGHVFVQINFTSGRKILLTDQLIGFKPVAVTDIDVAKLPKVVTTSDLLSVFEAIEESVSGASPGEETEILKRVFNSILLGGEQVGFDLTKERGWLRRLPTVTSKASA